jgi:ribosomal protein S18 acetylase RimI-like enzyme
MQACNLHNLPENY